MNKSPVSIVNARYIGTNTQEHCDNPLILALPQRADPKRMRQLLSVSVQSPNWEGLSQSDREACIRTIRNTRIMTRQHLDFYYEVYDMLKYGYIHRNPITPETIAWSYDLADSSIPLNEIQKSSVDKSCKPTTADAVFLTGFSGNGKSTMTEHILQNLLPTIIEHSYQGFSEPQVVYLKVDLPHNASRPGLIYQLLKELDRVLSHTSYGDSNYTKSVKTKTGRYIDVDSMVDVLVTVLVRHHVGLIVIDEFQNLQVASQRYRQEVIQLFDELSNRLYIPSVKIGTPDTFILFERNSRHKRRLGKPFELSRLADEKAKERMLKALFYFQPITHPIERTDALDTLIMDLTAGVPAYMVGLWEEALLEAIRSGKETISQVVIKKAFKQRFPLLRSATRNINKNKKGKHTDLLTVQQYLDSDNNSIALKHLNHFIRKAEIQGVAAAEVLNDIEEMEKQYQFSETEKKTLTGFRDRLTELAKANNPSQTIEHKA
ncbi:MAG: nucleoside-triphosphatase THEP1 [Cocleimonas sp.]|jgi:nucleoside-triphosphatase THEP1